MKIIRLQSNLEATYVLGNPYGFIVTWIARRLRSKAHFQWVIAPRFH
jgi:hypothetical protein